MPALPTSSNVCLGDYAYPTSVSPSKNDTIHREHSHGLSLLDLQTSTMKDFVTFVTSMSRCHHSIQIPCPIISDFIAFVCFNANQNQRLVIRRPRAGPGLVIISTQIDASPGRAQESTPHMPCTPQTSRTSRLVPSRARPWLAR